MSSHKCHARKCNVSTPSRMFMCRKHWFMLPRNMRDKIWDLYVPGQEISRDPSSEYVEHARECVRYIAELEAA